MALTQISEDGVKTDAVSHTKLADNSVGSAELVSSASSSNRAVNQLHVKDEIIDEARLQISNAGTNGQFLQKQSGNTGGLTWADANQYTHPNHSGEVTSSADGAQTIASNVVDEDNLKISNAGTNGQYLQKQSGNTGGLTWADVTIPPSGNAVDLVADGAIAAGKPVIIKSNGKAEVIAEVLTTRAINDGVSVHNSNALNHNHGSLTGCYASGQNKWVTWHVNNDDSAKPWVTCWRHTGTNDISKDEGSAFSHIGSSSLLNDNDYRPRMAYDVNADKVVGIYRKPHPNNRMGAWCATVPTTNTTVTFGSGPIEAHADDVKMMDLMYDPDAQKCIAVFMDEGDSDKGKSVVLTTTGSGSSASVSASSAVTFYDSYCGYKALAYDTVNDKTVVFYTGASNYIYAKPASISGTTLTWGTQEGIVNAGVSNQIDVAYGNGIFFLVYSRSGDIKGKAVSYDGSSWSHGSEFDIVASCNDEWPEITFDPETNIFLIAIRVDTNGVRTYMATNSGTTISIGTTAPYHSGSNMNRRIFIPDKTGTTLLVHSSQSGSTRLKAVVTRHANLVSNLSGSAQNFLGFAEDAISDGATGTIKLPGNVVANQSGLTPGNHYYVTNAGAVESGGSHYSAGGLAIASDKMMIRAVPKT